MKGPLHTCLLFLSITVRPLAAKYDPQDATAIKFPDFGALDKELDDLAQEAKKSFATSHHLYNYHDVTKYQTKDGDITESQKGCLHYADNSVLQKLRIHYLAEMVDGLGPDNYKATGLDPDNYYMYVPNVGFYSNLEAAKEYSLIVDGEHNDGFTTAIKTTYVEDAPHAYFVSQDTLVIGVAQLRSWNNGQLVSPGLTFTEVHFRPCSIAVEGLVMTFDDNHIQSFVEQSFSNRYLCERIMGFCTEENQQYDDMEDCINFMDSLPKTDPACAGTASTELTEVSYSLEGNTTSCRFLHHFMSAKEFRPEIHCPHVGKHGGPDPNNQFKCSTAACDAKKRAKLETPAPVDLQSCQPEWKEEAEVALVAAMPSCLDAIENGTCSDECRQSLGQFGLSGFQRSAEIERERSKLPLRTRTCICSNDIQRRPRSSVLKLLPFSASALLASCGMRLSTEGSGMVESDPCGELAQLAPEIDGFSAEDARSEDFHKAVIADVVNRSIRGVEMDAWVDEEQQYDVESMTMDIEFVKDFHNLYFHHLLPEEGKNKKGGCPFFHGPLVTAHDDVLEVMSKPQNRSRSSFVLAFDFAKDEGFDWETEGFYSTGSPEHKGLRATYYEAFPVLAKPNRGPNELSFPSLPDELLDMPIAEYVSQDSASATSLQVFYRYLLIPLFPEASDDFLDKMADVVTTWSLTTGTPSRRSAKWHDAGGQGLLRLHSIHLKKASELMQSYFGSENMERFVDLTNRSLSAEQIARAWASQLFAGLGGIMYIQFPLLKQIATNPCKEEMTFQKDPHKYILELLRSSHVMPLGGNAIIDAGAPYSLEYGVDDVVYKGDTEWKPNATYAVQYSLSQANKDEGVFPFPNQFMPFRDNLNLSMTFGAPEYAFQSGLFDYDPDVFRGIEAAHGCIAHNYVLGALASMTQQLLEKEQFCYVRKHEGAFTASVVLCWALAGMIVILYCIIWACLSFWLKPQLVQFSERVRKQDLTDQTPPEQTGGHYLRGRGLCNKQLSDRYLSQELRPTEDFGKRKLSLQNVSLAKVQKASQNNYIAEKLLLDGLSVDVVAGNLTAIMGESGAGKSSLLNTIAGFNEAGIVASGSIEEISEAGRRTEGGVAYVHHDYKLMLFEELTGFENLVVGGLVRFKEMDTRRDELLQAISVLAHGLRLQDCLDTPVKDMSSGEKRRFSIAVECLRPSRVMLLDEPLSGLDSAVALDTIMFLKKIATEFHKIVLLIVHQPSQEIFEALDEVIVMKKAKCIYNGPTGHALDVLGCASSSKFANPADALMDFVASTDINSSLLKGTKACTPASIETNPVNISDADLVSFQQRFLACILVSWFSLRRNESMLILLFVAVPLAIFFLALYNVGPTHPHEAIAMMIMLIAGPPCLMIQATSAQRFSTILSLVNMKRFGLYSGVEYSLHLLLFYGMLSFVMMFIIFTSSLYVGLSEIMTSQRYLEALAIAFAFQFTTAVMDVTLGLSVSRPGKTEQQSYEVYTQMCGLLMLYLATGLVLSGLLYRTGTAGIPFLYDAISYLSPPFWAALALLVSLMEGAVFSGCSLEEGVFCLGDTYLISYGLLDRPYIPGFSIWVLLLMVAVTFPLALLFGSRPWAKPLQFVRPTQIVRHPIGSEDFCVSSTKTFEAHTVSHDIVEEEDASYSLENTGSLGSFEGQGNQSVAIEPSYSIEV